MAESEEVEGDYIGLRWFERQKRGKNSLSEGKEKRNILSTMQSAFYCISGERK